MSTEITINQDIVEVNVTEEVITIEAPSGAYPLPSTVSSVFGRTGNILALNGDYNTSLVTENTNLYFTNARARSAISLTTTGISGAATYNSSTGVLNVPQYQGGVTSFNTRTGAISLLSADVTGALGFTPYNATNPAGYISGITSGMVTTALGYTPVTNARTLTINGTSYDLTADRSWTIAAGVTSVFGRTGAVVATEGDYTLTQLGDVTITTPANGQVLKYNGTTWVNGTDTDTGLTSVGLSMPSAFTVTNSPLTANGTLSVTGAGTTAQYVRGDGSLATFPSVAQEAQRLITEVYNNSGVTLAKGTVVYINGGQGNLPTVTKALATGDATSAQTYGIVQTDITNMNNGFVVVIGSLSDLDTQAYAVGTQLYLSSTVAGAWTSVKQYAPAHLVYVGIVVRSHPTQGVVEVRIQNGFELDELHDVSAQSPTNGDILQYVASTDLWTKTAGTTTNIAEGTNLYYTDARSRAALSFVAGSGAYNSTTGVITIPTNNNQITNGSNYITLASLSAGTGISYNNTTGVITNSAPDQTVSLTSGTGISVSGTYPSFTIASTITQYTDALARASISLTTTGSSGAATYDNTTGVLNIPQYSGGGGGSISLAAIGSTPNANAATLTGTVLNLEPASASFGGVVTTGTQTFAGAKTFSSAVTALSYNVFDGSQTITKVNTSDLQFNASSAGSTILFRVAGDERMRITANGNTAFGSTTATSRLSVGNKLLMWDATPTGASASTEMGYLFNTTSQPAGSFVESAGAGTGTILSYGTNVPQVGTRNTSFVGGIFRLDTRAAEQKFVVFGYPTGGSIDTERISVNLQNGNTLLAPIAGNVGIGLSSFATMGSKLQINGNAAIGYSASTAAPTNGLAVSGNIGVNTTGSAWGSNYRVLELQKGSSFVNNNATNYTGVYSNAYYNGTNDIYFSSSFALKYEMLNGEHIWYNSGIGSTGGVVSFNAAMRINNSSNLGLGTTTIGSKLQVNGNAAIGYSASTAAPTNGLLVNGNVGIGTSTFNYSSAGRGDLAVSGTTDSILELQANSTTISYLYAGTSNVDLRALSSRDLTFSTTVGETIRITSAAGNVGIGTTTIGSKLQVNGNAAIGYSASTAAPTNGLAVSGSVTVGTTSIASATNDKLTVRTDQNASTRVAIENLTTGTQAISEIFLAAGTIGNYCNFGKANASYTGYKTLGANSCYWYNGNAGNIVFLNDVASGNINFAAGASSTAQMTIASTGAVTMTNDVEIAGVLRATITTNRQTASYTLVLADRGKLVEMNVATANNLTIPLNSSVAFPIGTQIDLSQYGAGQTTVVATGGVTIRSTNSWVKLNAQYAAATLIKIGTDEWYLFGNLNA